MSKKQIDFFPDVSQLRQRSGLPQGWTKIVMLAGTYGSVIGMVSQLPFIYER